MRLPKKCFVLFWILAACTQTYSYGQKSGSVRRTSDSTFMTSDGVALYLRSAGKGTPCIFIHGGPGAWSRSFELMGGNVLEDKLTMYYYDQRGSGRSASAPDTNYSLDRMTEDIENIRSITGAEQVYVMAHSFGGILAYAYAQKYPSHVKGMIFLNATLFIDHSLLNQVDFVNRTLGVHIKADTNAVFSSFLEATKLLRDAGLGYKMLSDSKVAVAVLDSVDRSFPRNHDFARYVLGGREYFTDFTAGTADVAVPVLVITGRKDNNIGPDHYKLFRFPNRKVKEIDGGHILYYERNKEFAEAVFGFVR